MVCAQTCALGAYLWFARRRMLWAHTYGLGAYLWFARRRMVWAHTCGLRADVCAQSAPSRAQSMALFNGQLISRRIFSSLHIPFFFCSRLLLLMWKFLRWVHSGRLWDVCIYIYIFFFHHENISKCRVNRGSSVHSSIFFPDLQVCLHFAESR